MKSFLLALVASSFSFSAYAEIRELNVYRDSALVSAYHSRIRMTDAKFVMIPKTIEIVPGRCHSDSQDDCTRAKTLEKVPVVQVVVEYRDGIFRDEGSFRTVDLEFNIPAAAFSENQLQELKEASRPDFFGKNQKIRKNWVNKNIEMEISKVVKSTRVLDESRSNLCEGEYIWERDPNCEIVRKYKTKAIHYKHIKLFLR